jgi:hypothetical protein
MKAILGENHVYHVGGRTPPSVTSILDLYFPPSNFYTPVGAMMGTARHQWFHALAQGLELENEPDRRIAGAVLGFKKFLEEVKPVYVSGEISYHDPILDVCGTPDLVAEIAGRLAVIDYKPENKNKRTQMQTAAYALMLRRNNVPVVDRYELRLGDGYYRLDKHRNADDEKRWPILVAAFRAAEYYR